MLLQFLKHDGSSQEIEVLAASFARKVATSFDWEAERRRFEQLAEEEEVPVYFPSISFVNDAFRILEFGPNTDDTFWVSYRYEVLKSSWGFMAVPQTVEQRLESCEFEVALEFLDHHYEGHHSELVKALPAAWDEADETEE